MLDEKHGRMSRSVVIIEVKRVSSNKHLILMCDRIDFFLSGCVACTQHDITCIAMVMHEFHD